MSWLDFENQEKGYKKFELTKQNVLANIGKRIVYVRRKDVDSLRGFCFQRYGTLSGVSFSQILFDNGDSIDRRGVIECGIELTD